jgi:hypothetical protein
MQTGPRGRRAVAESGAFGKSARRSRSKTGTPAKREDPTIQAADKVFTSWFEQSKSQADTTGAPNVQGRKGSMAGGPAPTEESTANANPAFASAAKERQPTEMVLKGYRSPDQQYAAIRHYEQLAGRICEDYPRDPPAGARRYKSDLRDPAFTRPQGLTRAERAMVNRADSGEHWVKVTFESAEAAEAALFASPQTVMGFQVSAEPYLGVRPADDEAIPDPTEEIGWGGSVTGRGGFGSRRSLRRGGQNAPGASGLGNGHGQGTGSGRATTTPFDASPPHSHSSSRTVETGTVSATTSATLTGPMTPIANRAAVRHSQTPGGGSHPSSSSGSNDNNNNGLYCRTIPSARKVRLMPAEQALRPQPSLTDRMLKLVPVLQWFGGSMIGNQVPRNELGNFDWDKASLYWKMVWWLDATFGLFGGEILSADKED